MLGIKIWDITTWTRGDFTLAEAKADRSKKRQLGQFLTPTALAEAIVADTKFVKDARVLEPSFGDGSFLIPVVRELMRANKGPVAKSFEEVMATQLFGVELDPDLYARALVRLEDEFGPLPEEHNLVCGDFFKTEFMARYFDVIIGNPPFGGTFDPSIEDSLDRRFGKWEKYKLKKETYSFFIAKSLELLAPNGELVFISSDTFLTINTMKGLRAKLMDLCNVYVSTLDGFSDETSHPMLVLRAVLDGPSEWVQINSAKLDRTLIELTGNLSWGMQDGLVHFFQGPTIGEKMVATSGMTVGKNELFVRDIIHDQIEESYDFEFFEDPITLKREVERARLNKLSPSMVARIRQQEIEKVTRRNVRVVKKKGGPVVIQLPNPSYRYYNKADSGIVYSAPKAAIFWEDDGDAVLTFKKNGNWYLHGVGGQPFFQREGLTWQLISPRINMRYLPSGQILDSGAPCLFLRPDVDREELWIVLGWTLTDKATEIMKTVINHTRNIQGKDVERLPYPFWLSADDRGAVTNLVQMMVKEGQQGRVFQRRDSEFVRLEELFAFPE